MEKRLEKHIYDQYVMILKDELVPALGCTEPIAIAYAAAKARQQTVHARSRSRQTGKRAEPGRRTSKARQTQRSRTTGRTQSMHTGRERPVWKDNKKPYVRKKRKIG